MGKTLFSIGFAALSANLLDLSANIALLQAASIYLSINAVEYVAERLARRLGYID
jgi:hypothetical protein